MGGQEGEADRAGGSLTAALGASTTIQNLWLSSFLVRALLSPVSGMISLEVLVACVYSRAQLLDEGLKVLAGGIAGGIADNRSLNLASSEFESTGRPIRLEASTNHVHPF
ncbi:expressed unknown protein [Seminavis robusta]|uniref:Uncharacterized protein n=1 Tax=Seminavis robusta TaxID=568900 RepID=A0A9N8HPG5_9STRA|nr:expressed unknown protein [Seminavis robusta]|eukprot:Sro1086_g239771.1  (110) ;mRNA; r:31293-31622